MDLNEYLDSLSADGAMSAEDRTTLAGILSKSPKAAEKAVKGFMLQSDYTKKTQELATERQRSAAELTAMNSQLSKALKDLENGKTTAAQYSARLESIQEEYGIDVSDVLKGKTAPVTPAPEVKPVIDPDIIKRLELAERNYAYNPEVSALLLDAQVEYQRTFGNLDGFSASEVLKYARENKVAIRGDQAAGTNGAFERLYKIPEKRREVEIKTAVDKALENERAEAQKRFDAALSGKATGNQNPDAWHQGSGVLTEDFQKRNAVRMGSVDDKGAPVLPPSQSRSAAQSQLEGGGARFAKAFIQRRANGVGLGQEGKAA